MHSVVCIVYVERYLQTIHRPVDTPASEVFSRPSTQILFGDFSREWGRWGTGDARGMIEGDTISAAADLRDAKEGRPLFFSLHVVLLETRVIKPTFNRLIPTIFSSPLKITCAKIQISYTVFGCVQRKIVKPTLIFLESFPH